MVRYDLVRRESAGFERDGLNKRQTEKREETAASNEDRQMGKWSWTP